MLELIGSCRDSKISSLLYNFTIREAVLVPLAETWGRKVAFVQPGMASSAYILKA